MAYDPFWQEDPRQQQRGLFFSNAGLLNQGRGGGGGMGGGALKGLMGIFKSIGGFIKKLKAGLLFLLLPAVLTFINSEHFQKALNIINEVLLPALKKVWNWIKLLFSDPMAALAKLWDEYIEKI